jgi:uncharacterized protein (TIGR02145 family)
MKSLYTPSTAILMFMSLWCAKAQTIMNIHQSNGTVLQIPLNTIDSITYTINNPGVLATLSTLPIGNITSTSATSGGNITANGGTSVTQRGVVWSTSPNPTTANSLSNNGNGTGNYTSTLSGLAANTTYYVRAYAINSAGTAYGNQLTFTTTGGGSNIISNPGAGVTFNGYTYSSIVLGNGQEWMAENLRTATYRNGDPIPNVTGSNQWYSLSSGAWAHYNNDSQYENPFGKLYNWHAVADPRNVCPTGWHVPTDAEWTALTDYLGGEAVAGGKMKSVGTIEAGTGLWYEPNTDATNESGFSGLPGGGRDGYGGFGSIGGGGGWWSSSESNAASAWDRILDSANGFVYRSNDYKGSGFSVRCLRD